MASILLSDADIRRATILVSNDIDGVDDDTFELYVNFADATIIQRRGAHPVVAGTDSTAVQASKTQELERRRVCLVELINNGISADPKPPEEVVNRILPVMTAWF